MAIAPISGALTALPSLAVKPGATTAPTAGTTGAAPTGAFPADVGKALDALSVTQDKADALAVQGATGDLADASEFMIAATQASLATELTVAVRNKAVESFQAIMNMGV
jgi:flagellar hook-basal body complex protein FliE